MSLKKKPETIDQYIDDFPPDVQKRMQKIRLLINKAAPQAEEKISYSIPAFFLDGKYFLYFAGYKNHIGMYPIPSGNKLLAKEFASYKTSGKGAIQFQHVKPLPVELIRQIIDVRLKERNAKFSEIKFATKKSTPKITPKVGSKLAPKK